MQVAVVGEGEVAPDAVDRDAQQLGVELLELRQELVVERQLVAADRAPVGGVEDEDHGLRRGTSESETFWSGSSESVKSGAGVPAGRGVACCDEDARHSNDSTNSSHLDEESGAGRGVYSTQGAIADGPGEVAMGEQRHRRANGDHARSTSTFRREALDDLRRRIAATRWPSKELVDDRSQGVQLATLQALAEYWTTEYDWRKCEAS